MANVTHKQPKTLSEVRDALCQAYTEVMTDVRRVPQVHEASNALGKVVGTCKIRLEAASLSGEKLTGDWANFMNN